MKAVELDNAQVKGKIKLYQPKKVKIKQRISNYHKTTTDQPGKKKTQRGKQFWGSTALHSTYTKRARVNVMTENGANKKSIQSIFSSSSLN